MFMHRLWHASRPPRMYPNIHTFHDLPKHDVLAVQVRGGHCSNKELAPVRVGPAVRHRQQPRPVMFQAQILKAYNHQYTTNKIQVLSMGFSQYKPQRHYNKGPFVLNY